MLYKGVKVSPLSWRAGGGGWGGWQREAEKKGHWSFSDWENGNGMKGTS